MKEQYKEYEKHLDLQGFENYVEARYQSLQEYFEEKLIFEGCPEGNLDDKCQEIVEEVLEKELLHHIRCLIER